MNWWKEVLDLNLIEKLIGTYSEREVKRKKELRGYSVNQYLTEILTKDLEAEDNG